MKEINEKIRKIRKDKKITLKELSNRTDLSVSFLSQVERGVSSFTITSLKKIADGLEVSLQEIVDFEKDDEVDFTSNKSTYVRIQKEYDSHKIISGKFSGRKLEGIIYTLKPGKDTSAFSHDGEEIHYILQGLACFVIEDKEYILEVGETIHFPSTLKHNIKCIGDEDLKILSVLTPTIF